MIVVPFLSCQKTLRNTSGIIGPETIVDHHLMVRIRSGLHTMWLPKRAHRSGHHRVSVCTWLESTPQCSVSQRVTFEVSEARIQTLRGIVCTKDTRLLHHCLSGSWSSTSSSMRDGKSAALSRLMYIMGRISSR